MSAVAEGLEVDVAVPGRVAAAFTAEPGEVVAVLGPNGAGKSTTLQAVAGLLGDALKVQISAPPERGRANERLCEVLARTTFALTT